MGRHAGVERRSIGADRRGDRRQHRGRPAHLHLLLEGLTVAGMQCPRQVRRVARRLIPTMSSTDSSCCNLCSNAVPRLLDAPTTATRKEGRSVRDAVGSQKFSSTKLANSVAIHHTTAKTAHNVEVFAYRQRKNADHPPASLHTPTCHSRPRTATFSIANDS